MVASVAALYTELVGIQHYKENIMWKIVVGFLVFAAVALYLLSKGGDIDMSGEKHGSNSFVVENT
jgi:hypothetical protein